MLSKIINSPTVVNHVKNVVSNPTYAARFLVGGAVAKDIVQYGTLAYKSYNNKELPEKQRKVTAAMDGATGILNCAAQLTAGFALSSKNVQKKMGDFLFKGLIEAGEHATVAKCRTGLAIASSLLLTTVVVKRIIVPLLAAPIASYGTEHLYNQEKAKFGNKLEKSA